MECKNLNQYSLPPPRMLLCSISEINMFLWFLESIKRDAFYVVAESF